MHSSCFSRHGAYITHIAAELPMVQLDLDGKCYHNIGLYSLEPLASSRHEEQYAHFSSNSTTPHFVFPLNSSNQTNAGWNDTTWGNLLDFTKDYIQLFFFFTRVNRLWRLRLQRCWIDEMLTSHNLHLWVTHNIICLSETHHIPCCLLYLC